MSLKELNSAEIEQVSGGTFLLKAFLLSRLFNPQGSGPSNPQGSGCNSCNQTPIQPTPPVVDSPCSSGDFGFNKWFKFFKF